MQHDTRRSQVQQIMHELASLPGSQAVDITTRRLPRFGPAEPGTSYDVHTRSFSIEQMPEALSVPCDSEDIIIRLHGALTEEPDAKDTLVNQLRALFDEPELHENWDVRTHFHVNGGPTPTYMLSVFSHMHFTAPDPMNQ